MANEVEQILRMARAYAAEQLPWFAPALYAAPLVLTDHCPSVAAVDEGMRIYFNPERVRQLLAQAGTTQRALRQLAFLWVHEICHVLRRHAERAKEKGAEPIQWNIAADLEINDAQWKGLEIPEAFPPLLPKQFGLPEGKLAEFYYDALEQMKEVRSTPDESQLTQNSQVNASQNPPSERSQGSKGAKLSPPWGRPFQEGEWEGLPDEGSGVHGQKRWWELPADDKRAPARSEIDKELIRREVAEEIRQRKSWGDIPAGWKRWAEEVLNPKMNWRELLKRKVRGALTIGTGQRIDYSFARPHRRAEVYDPVLPPSLQGDFSPRVACVVDTSGSMSKRKLAQALAEVRKVLETFQLPITVIPCDAVPYEPIQVFTSSQAQRLRLRGGGGTNMVAGIEAALKLRPIPDVVIVLTDGYTPFPPKRYKVPVLFGIFDPTGDGKVPKPPMPPWRDQDVVIIPLRE
jgi:predicted metal-dependent peptidase